MEKPESFENNTQNTPAVHNEESNNKGNTSDAQKEYHEKEVPTKSKLVNTVSAEGLGGGNATKAGMVSLEDEEDKPDFEKHGHGQEKELSSEKEVDFSLAENPEAEKCGGQQQHQVESLTEMEKLNIAKGSTDVDKEKGKDDSTDKGVVGPGLKSEKPGEPKNLEEILYEEKEAEPIFDGTEVPGIEGYAWPEKAVALTNFVREKGSVAVSTVLRRLSGKSDDGQDIPNEEDKKNNDNSSENDAQEVTQKPGEKSMWNPLSLIKVSLDSENKVEYKEEVIVEAIQPIAMKGRIILYTRLGCQDCKEARQFLHRKRLRYVEINIDVYPGRKLELEKIAGSSLVPRVFFNEVLIGGLSELKELDETKKLEEKIEYVVAEGPSFEAPLPPLSGEDDVSSNGPIDELAVIVGKMKESIVVKDRFYKMRWFTNSFLGSEAADFLSEDQYLEREEAIEFGRKLATNLFFQHVLEENLFEDGNHLYRFLDHDPIVSQCQNISRGIIELKPKPLVEISSRLRFLSYAIFEAYTSEDGKHVDYRSIHVSEEFARYLRVIEELQRVDLQDMTREEKLAFFINLYNMMAIHAILVWGHPVGALERRKLFGDFKYVIGGCTYSLSAIQNGILRSNQRPPYNLIKPFGVKDKRVKVALAYPEPLVHFALVSGTRSGPALRCYSPGNIDKELMEAARGFLRSGGLIVDLNAKVATVNKILKWYSADFGKNEVEVLKHAANYLELVESQALLELLANTQLKVVYQPYDWGLNH